MKNNKEKFIKLISALKSLLLSLQGEKEAMIESMKFAGEGMIVASSSIGEVNHDISCLEKLLSIPNESIEFLKELIKVV